MLGKKNKAEKNQQETQNQQYYNGAQGQQQYYGGAQK